jgi:CRISPR system Cascade subunit CasE
MTHLTQVNLPYELAAKLRLRDSYDWHQRAWECFPGRPRDARDFLTRLDEKPEGFRLLIVSPREPARPDWCPADDEHWRTKPIPETYFGRSRYAFQLRANPTKKVTALNPEGSPRKNSRRVPLRTREMLLAWLQRKAEQGGFRVDPEKVRTTPEGPERFSKPGACGTHTAVDFRGVLEVTDPAAFHGAFTRGIGSAKAFGFGMLVIAPIK